MKIQCLAATLAIIGQNPADAFLFPNQRKPFRVSSTSLNQQKAFVNDGAFSFMQPFLGVFEEGKTTNYAVPLPVDEADIPSEEEQIMRRTEAAANMTNIGMEERERRGDAASIFQKITIGYAFYSSLFLDDGGIGGHLARFAIVLPLFFTFGFKKSAESGL